MPELIQDEITTQVIEDHLPFCFLSGAAGTGKTTLARQLVADRDDALLLATTGIAAVNLGDAATINSVLHYFDTQSLWSNYASGYLQTRLRNLRRSGKTLLVLDEVSMLDADQLTVLVQAIEDVDRTRTYDASLEADGGEPSIHDRISLLLVGDFAQLAPVQAKYAFESPAWMHFKTLTLRTIRRQGDERFIEALQNVRKGHAQAALETFRPCFVPTIDFAFTGTTIVAQNVEVDRINGLRHGQLKGEPIKWATVRSGEQQKDWIRLIPEEVAVKPGALVMILANRSIPIPGSALRDYVYVNGDLGVVLGPDQDGIRVHLHRGGETVVVPVTREWKEPTGKKNPAFEIKGSVSYMPVRLAWATTTHKVQGLSLDQVQVSISNWMFEKPSMMYVALSRARTLEGLRIVGSPQQFLRRCKVEEGIRAWL